MKAQKPADRFAGLQLFVDTDVGRQARLRMARELGVKVHPSSGMMGWETRNGVHHLGTPGGTVRARAVGIATGGYPAPRLHPKVKSRMMPILSNSVVTRPMTAEEKEACNFKTNLMMTDTRTLRHYYRQLPDDRLQIGSRSITGADAENPKHLALLLEGLYRKLPPLRGIGIDYSWWGWLDVSHDIMPRIFQPDPKRTIYCAMSYGGNGVMYSAQAGRGDAWQNRSRAGRLLRRFREKGFEVSALLVAALAHAVLAELLQLQFIVGALTAGLFFGRKTIDERAYDDVRAKTSAMTFGFLAPIFFASVGLNLDFSAVLVVPAFVLCLVVAAFVGKFVGAGIAARGIGLSRQEAAAVGVGMSARGAVEPVIADIALKAGLFDVLPGTSPVVENMFSAIVILAVLTTLITPVLMKRVYR